MPLSDHEQRMLDEIESALYAEDPKFASSVRKTSTTRRSPIDGKVVALAVLGLGVLIAGLVLPLRLGSFPVLSFVGFLMMFGAGILFLRSTDGGSGGSDDSAKASGASGAAGGSARGSAKPSGGGARNVGGQGGQGRRGRGGGGKSGQSYTERMEEKFRKRFEEGDPF